MPIILFSLRIQPDEELTKFEMAIASINIKSVLVCNSNRLGYVQTYHPGSEMCSWRVSH